MMKTKKLQWKAHLIYGVLAVVMTLTIAFCNQLVAHAQSQGKVIANSANIRKEADPNSAGIGSAAKDASVTINFQTTGTDGNTWYQVFVDANTKGFIRSDLVQITDGSTPATQNAETVIPSAPAAPTVAVNPISPVGATVKGSDSVRVRSDANTSGNNIVTTAKKGLAVTVTGEATGSDGKTWYQVTFISDNKEVTGFIRSDYIELSGEVVAAPEEPEAPAEEPEEAAPEEVPTYEPEPNKPYETAFANDKWYLYDYEEGQQYPILDFISAAETNAQLYKDEAAKTKTQKTAIIILVILVVLLVAAVAFLVYKLRDMMDASYFSQVEKETANRRTAQRPQGQRPQGQRPQGQRPQGQRPEGARPQGQRPQGQKSEDARPQGQRPEGARPQGQRPEGARPQGQRPEGARPEGARPQGARPEGARPQGARPEGARPQGQRPEGTRPQGARPAQGGQPKQGGNPQNPGWKSRNFMQDEDEFEFEFLNWDGEEE